MINLRIRRASLALIGVSVIALGAISALASGGGTLSKYNPIALPNSNTPTGSVWSENKYSAMRNFSNANAGSNNWSPKYWGDIQDPARRYQSETYFIAHRGLVDLNSGIAENSLDAVYNAIEHNQYMIEIDVQVSKSVDGKTVPMPLHDNSLRRPLNRTELVRNVSYAQMKGQTIRIQNHDQSSYPSTPIFCSNGNKLMSLEDMIKTVEFPTSNRGPNLTHGNNHCPAHGPNKVTWVLDPKNLGSVKSIISFIRTTQNLNSTSDNWMNKFVIKVYPNYYTQNINFQEIAGTLTTQVENVAANTGGQSFGTKKLRVIPVIDVKKMLDEDRFDAAVNHAVNVTEDWGNYFEVVSLEIPGAWHRNWPEFVRRLRLELEDKADYHLVPNNPESHTERVNGHEQRQFRYPPSISAGYRFADYVRAEDNQNNEYPTFRKSKAYDWQMDGTSKEDKADMSRRIIAGTAASWAPLCKGLKGCWITTDYPLHEYYKYRTNQTNPDPVHNAPASNINGQH